MVKISNFLKVLALATVMQGAAGQNCDDLSCFSDDAKCKVYGQVEYCLNGEVTCPSEAFNEAVCPCFETASQPGYSAWNYCMKYGGEACMIDCVNYVTDCCPCVETECELSVGEQCAIFDSVHSEVVECEIEREDIQSSVCWEKYDGIVQLLCPCDDDEDDEDDADDICDELLGIGGSTKGRRLDGFLTEDCRAGCLDFYVGCCGLSECFPKDALVEVENKGYIPLKELKLGDKVRSSTGFSEVYAFGTRDLSKITTFLKLNTASSLALELSPNHLVFVGKNFEPKLASEVVAGDLIMSLPDKTLEEVISVEFIEKEGPVHPMTYDGTIVVNGILASVHAIDEYAPVVKIGNYELVDKHQFQQMLMSPLRLLCKISSKEFCSEENHAVDDGGHHWIEIIESFQTFMSPEEVGGDCNWESTQFLEFDAFLPMKLIFLSWMLFCSALELVFSLRFMAVMASFAVWAWVKPKFAVKYQKQKQA